MIEVLLVVVVAWLGAAVLGAVLAGSALRGARRLADRYERPTDLRRTAFAFEHLANHAVPANAFGAAADSLSI